MLPTQEAADTGAIVSATLATLSWLTPLNAILTTIATISHGLSVTPTMVNVTPTVTGLSNIYVSAIGASTFTVNYTGGGSNAFLWEARGGGEYGF